MSPEAGDDRERIPEGDCKIDIGELASLYLDNEELGKVIREMLKNSPK